MTLHLTGTREPFTLRFEHARELAARCAAPSGAPGGRVRRCSSGRPWSSIRGRPERGRVRLARDRRGLVRLRAARARRRRRRGARRAAALEADGPGRFAAVAAAWRELAGGTRRRRPGPPGSGLVAVGGFAFAPTAAAPRTGSASRRRRWSSRGRARAPQRRGQPDRRHARRTRRLPEQLAERMAARVAPCATPSCRCSTRRPPGDSRSPASRRPSTTSRRSPAPSSGSGPARSRRSCSRARSPSTPRRRTTSRPSSASCARRRLLLRLLRRPRRSAFVAASPRAARPPRGLRAQSVALAGRSGAPPTRPSTTTLASSGRLGEGPRGQAIVSDRSRASAPARGVGRRWPRADRDQRRQHPHLATPIRAQLTHPVSVVELAAMLHPTRRSAASRSRSRSR